LSGVVSHHQSGVASVQRTFLHRPQVYESFVAILYAYHSSQIDVDQVNQHINALLRVPTTAFPSLPLPPAFPDLPPFLFSSWPPQNYPSLLASFKQFLPHRP
jgi:histone deacetylase complex regulatory component SIN3